ncbi:hypothetical protein [Yoonia sp.]|uniref:hypothetical protein n=1 Tax=Yoonia sp. TaxID=2212373 RepID=UPI003A4E2BC4
MKQNLHRAGHAAPRGVGVAGHLGRATLGLVGLALLLLIWWVLTEVLPPERSFARRFSPAQALPTFWQLITGSALWDHTGQSMRCVLVGLSAALAIGIPLGLLVGASRLADPSEHSRRGEST